MATNPKIPPRRDFDGKRERAITAEQRTNWGPPLMIIAALAVIGALIWWLSGSPNQKPAPTSVTGHGVQLTNLSTSVPTVSGAVEVTGTLVNNGNAPITAVKVQADFRNVGGKTLETEAADVQPANAVQTPSGLPAGSTVGNQPSNTHGFVKPGGDQTRASSAPNGQNEQPGPGFANNPIPPGQSVPIAIRFTHMPEGATQGLPRIRITDVETGTGAAQR